jgi:hypothetical protein
MSTPKTNVEAFDEDIAKCDFIQLNATDKSPEFVNYIEASEDAFKSGRCYASELDYIYSIPTEAAVDINSISEDELESKYNLIKLGKSNALIDEKVKEVLDEAAESKRKALEEADENKKKALDKMAKKISELESDLQTVEDDNKTLSGDLDGIKSELAKKATKVDELIAHLAAYKSWARTVEALCTKSGIKISKPPTSGAPAKKAATKKVDSAPPTSTTPTADGAPPAPTATGPSDEEILKIDKDTASAEELLRYIPVKRKLTAKGANFDLNRLVPPAIRGDADKLRKVIKDLGLW